MTARERATAIEEMKLARLMVETFIGIVKLRVSRKYWPEMLKRAQRMGKEATRIARLANK
jgi:hypothetical protein